MTLPRESNVDPFLLRARGEITSLELVDELAQERRMRWTVTKTIQPGGDYFTAVDGPCIDRVELVRLHDVLVVLENAYHPQNPSPAHPADMITKAFGDGDA